MSPRPLSVFASLAVATLMAAYVPDMGRGFIKDDFAWIAASRVDGPTGLAGLFGRDNGFYRPLVGVSFAVDAWLFDLRPRGYAATNLLLVVLAAGAVLGLARALGLAAGEALAAACVWALSPHGIGGAVMWISGRTALLLTLFAVLAAWAFVRGRATAAALLVLLALFCKEEATLLPAVLAVWAVAGVQPGEPGGARRGLAALLPFTPVLALYLLLRARTQAYWPATAPGYYRPTFDAATLARNLLEYADRAVTFPAAVVLLAAVVAWSRPRLSAVERRRVALALAWLAGGYGLTVFLPVRSSLYACFPSVGAALAAAVLLGACVRAAGVRASRRLTVAALVAIVALVPLLRSRNRRLRRTAELSSRALAAAAGTAPELAAGAPLVLHDADGKVNLRAAFGTLAETAVRLRTGVAGAQVWIEPPPPGSRAAGLRPPHAAPPVAFELRAGEMTRVR